MDDSKRGLLPAAIIGLAGLVVLVDLFVPESVACWLFYLPVVLLSVRLHSSRATMLTAAGCSLLILGGLLSPPVLPLAWRLTNRVLALGALWLMALVGLVLTRRTTELAEIKARQAQDILLAEAVANLNEGVVITDARLEWPGPRILFVNRAMTQITGYAADELIGQTPRMLQGERSDRAVLGRLRRELAEARPFRGELVNYRKDGSTYDVEITIAPVLDAGGRMANYVAVHRDITSRKRAEEALRVSEEALRNREARLSAILETAADAIITIDERGIIESVNPAAEQMFGYAAGEMVGQNVTMLMPSPDREEHDGYIARYLKTGVKHIIGIRREVQGRRKDGTGFPVELAVSESRDGQRWFTGTLRDLSRRKALEREVVESAAQEEQRIGRELHDGVGQELTGLGLMADALARRLEKRLPDVEPLAVKLASGLERLHQQVRALCQGLILTGLDAEGLRLALEELAARTSEQSGISCCFDCPEPVPVPDPSTTRHLYRIAQEAVSNALRHGKPRHIRLVLRCGSNDLRLSIQDDGIGMPDLLPYQGEGKGTGMGIPTMRYRAGMIGGTLQIGPADGGGTLVTCSVPRRNGRGED